jgi:hypothetical protein
VNAADEKARWQYRVEQHRDDGTLTLYLPDPPFIDMTSNDENVTGNGITIGTRKILGSKVQLNREFVLELNQSTAFAFYEFEPLDTTADYALITNIGGYAVHPDQFVGFDTAVLGQEEIETGRPGVYRGQHPVRLTFKSVSQNFSDNTDTVVSILRCAGPADDSNCHPIDSFHLSLPSKGVSVDPAAAGITPFVFELGSIAVDVTHRAGSARSHTQSRLEWSPAWETGQEVTLNDTFGLVANLSFAPAPVSWFGRFLGSAGR